MNIRRKLSGLLIASLMLAAFSITVNADENDAATVSATIINGVRGDGFLVIYTPEYGKTTGTNPYGIEAAVDANNVVISVGDNNTEIPEGGFVISGHNADNGSSPMKTWIKDNVHVGDYAYFNKNSMQLTVSSTPLDIDVNGFYELRGTYTAKNKTRSANYLVIYEPSFGSTTKTNEYGFEVIVRDGKVTSVGGNDSAIPKDGFVLSGHGTMHTWLMTSVKLGMKVVLDATGNGFTLIYDEESVIFSIENELSLLPKEYENAKKNYLYMDYAAYEKRFDEINREFEAAVNSHKNGGSDGDFVNAGSEILSSINTLRRSITESYTVQYRAAWLRPNQKSAAAVEEYVKTLHDAGINTVCVEGIFDNTVIFNVPEGCLFEHNRSFNYDVLQAYIDACHKYDMECHLWMAIYLVGESNQASFRRSVAYKKPEWLSRDQKGNGTTPIGFAMLDPANEEARDYLLSFYTYILQTYDIDCFQLDYIRYYDRNEESDYGYTETAFEQFKSQYGYTQDPTYNTSAKYWDDWVKFRKDSITELVRGLRDIVDTYKPSVLISADVIPSLSGAGTHNYQDYPQWMKEGLLDILHPMAYVDGYGDDIKAQVKLGGDRCMVVTGLGVFKDELGADDMARQAIDDNGYGAYGEAYFEAVTYLKDKADEALLQTVYRNDAMTPFSDRTAAIKASLEYMLGRIDDVLIPLEGVTADEAASLKNAVTNAIASVKDSRIAPDEWTILKNAVNSVKKVKAKKVLMQDLLRAERIICTTYKVNADKLGDDLVLPVGKEFPEYRDPYAPEVGSEPVSEPVSDDSREEESEAVSEDSINNVSEVEKGSASRWIIPVSAAAVVAIAIGVAMVIKRKNSGEKK